MVPKQELALYLTNKSKRIVCHLNDVLSFQCGLMPNGDSEYFIMVNKEIQKK
ncbi:MAG: hypothetical protein ACI8ZN_002012 [Bacteroidia bacterium]|jgi:hypothetical protein